MGETIGYAELVCMLRRAAERVREERERLSELDSQGGDGDHGTTMARAMDRLEGALESGAPPALGPLLQAVGWAIMGVDGGATGPLLGSFFMAMAPPAASTERLDAAGLAALFEAGLAGVRQNTRAQIGDKTMIDALEPAVEALAAAAAESADITAALERAARAAESGAAATAQMAARFGRAKHLGERSKGHRDPGATSISLIFLGLCEGARADG
jgi:dihydroxyacetone kinase-like protein